MIPICQLCNSEGHTAPFCEASSYKKTKCHICGRNNHTTWYCFYNDKGPNYIGVHAIAAYSLQTSYPIQPQNLQYTSYRAPSPHLSFTSSQFQEQQPPMQAMHTMFNSTSPSSNSLGSSQVAH
jgi:hypothetical protein